MTTLEIELKALMLASLDGDAASHRALLDRLSRRLRAYYKGKLAGTGRDVTEAEDLVQEAVLAIHIKRHTYDPAEPLTPWVHAIARYKLIDFLRRSRASISDVPINEADATMAHDDNVAAESTYDVKKLLARLPKNMRCSIEAVKLDGQSIAEAAARCGISESGVKVNIHRGLKALATLIAQETDRGRSLAGLRRASIRKHVATAVPQPKGPLSRARLGRWRKRPTSESQGFRTPLLTRRWRSAKPTKHGIL